MRNVHRPKVRLEPLLQIYRNAGLATGADLAAVPGLGKRFAAVLAGRERFLNDAFLDGADDGEFREALVEFYEACVFPPLQSATLLRRTGILRHALAYLLRGRDDVERKIERCLSPGGAYFLGGLGAAFWSAVCQGLEPTLFPGCLRGVQTGLVRLGLMADDAVDEVARYRKIRHVYAHLLAAHPDMSALHLDHFLSLVGCMEGRELWSGRERLSVGQIGCDLQASIREARTRQPVRSLLKQRGKLLHQAKCDVQQCLTGNGWAERVQQLSMSLLQLRLRLSPDDHEALREWAYQLWDTSEPYALLDVYWQDDATQEAPPWLPTFLLHIQDPQHYFPWLPSLRAGLVQLRDDVEAHDITAENYRMFNEAIHGLCRRHKIHPLEALELLRTLAEHKTAEFDEANAFHGFCVDTFAFLDDLEQNNSLTWMNTQRARYKYVVRDPLVELCQTLAARYIEPVLNGRQQWNLETAARTGKALTSVCKNDYGKSAPYQNTLWITFQRRQAGKKRKDVQLFVRVAASGVGFGFRLGREARAASKLFRKNVQEHADVLWQALSRTGALAACQFASQDDAATAALLQNLADMRSWVTEKTLVAGKFVPPESPLLRGDDLVGEIILTFDRLLPLLLFATAEDPLAALPAPLATRPVVYSADDFSRDTFLPAEWLQRARALLDMKRQLILQGVPGTGKTYVARRLANWLTGGQSDAIGLVQFHPAYSYEEFVEGIKVRSVESDGRHEVTYPVEDGLLCAFAAKAAASPQQNFVLIIDEINRGNLPKIFGELLYLLEYRDESILLPYSRRAFRLPANLYLLGTMNAADRSVALLDQALRRRFSFLEMVPDAHLLTRWLEAFPPSEGERFGETIVDLFQRLNKTLQKDLGQENCIGHSYFMIRDLTTAKLAAIWQHQVQPHLSECYHGRPDRVADLGLDKLWRLETTP